MRLSAGALRTVSRHPWPGNVTELRDALTAALGRRPVGVIEATDLPESCQSAPSATLRAVDRAERDAIVAALRTPTGTGPGGRGAGRGPVDALPEDRAVPDHGLTPAPVTGSGTPASSRATSSGRSSGR